MNNLGNFAPPIRCPGKLPNLPGLEFLPLQLGPLGLPFDTCLGGYKQLSWDMIKEASISTIKITAMVFAQYSYRGYGIFYGVCLYRADDITLSL